MKKATLILAVLIAIALVSSAFAVGPGKTRDWESANGKVTFSGDTHSKAGNKCNDCHPKVFAMKKGAFSMTKADHVPGKFCGTCHDGKKAFAQDEANCAKCHKK